MFLSTTATKKKQVRHIDQELAKAKIPTKLGPVPTLANNDNNLFDAPSDRPIWAKRHIKPGGAIEIEEGRKSLKEKISDFNYDKLKLYFILSAGIILMVFSLANGNYGIVSVSNGFYNSNLKLISGISPIVVKEKFNPILRSEPFKIFKRSNISNIKLIDYLTFKELISIDPVELKNIQDIVNLDSKIVTDFIQTVRNKLGK